MQLLKLLVGKLWAALVANLPQLDEEVLEHPYVGDECCHQPDQILPAECHQPSLQSIQQAVQQLLVADPQLLAHLHHFHHLLRRQIVQTELLVLLG